MPYVVMTASLPSRGGQRRRIAVVETDLPPGQRPSRIDTRVVGCVRIVEEWPDLNIGYTRASRFVQAREAAEELAQRLTAEAANAHPRERLAELADDRQTPTRQADQR